MGRTTVERTEKASGEKRLEFWLIQSVPEGKSIFWEVMVSIILSKNVCIYSYMCPIPNGFRDTAISLFSSEIVYKKEILHTVSIYCSRDKVGKVFLV
jgi:hypothetical protein